MRVYNSGHRDLATSARVDGEVTSVGHVGDHQWMLRTKVQRGVGLRSSGGHFAFLQNLDVLAVSTWKGQITSLEKKYMTGRA